MTLTAHQKNLTNLIMSKKVLISMLKQGNNGNEILMILDAIASDAQTEPTLEEIEF